MNRLGRLPIVDRGLLVYTRSVEFAIAGGCLIRREPPVGKKGAESGLSAIGFDILRYARWTRQKVPVVIFFVIVAYPRFKLLIAI